MHPRSLTAACLAATLAAPALASNPFAPSRAELKPDPRLLRDCTDSIRAGVMKLDRAGDLTMPLGMLKLVPSRVELQGHAPAGVRVEPDYRGQPMYGTLGFGSQPDEPAADERWFVIDYTEDDRSWIYADLNGDGDLTNDLPAGDGPGSLGAWDDRNEHEDRPTSFSVFLPFEIRYDDAGPDGTATTSPFGLNLFWTASNTTVGAYRGGATIGQIDIAGETVPVALVDNGNTGDYFSGFDIAGGYDQSERTETGLILIIGGRSYDARGTINHNGVNYVPRTTRDGRTLVLEPTPRIIDVPLSKEKQGIATKAMLQAGEKAPDFEALLANGDTFRLADLIGEKVIVLDFWATWCGPCMKAMPHLADMKRRASDDLEIVAVHVADTKAAFAKFVDARQDELGLLFAHDPAGNADRLAGIQRRLYGVRGLPTTFVIDKDGVIRLAQAGFIDEGKPIERTLEELGVTFDEG